MYLYSFVIISTKEPTKTEAPTPGTPTIAATVVAFENQLHQ